MVNDVNNNYKKKKKKFNSSIKTIIKHFQIFKI